MVIALHGGGGSGAQFEATSGLTQQADAARVAVVYPDGTAGGLGLRTWNGGGCCGHAVAADIDDVEFMRQLIAHLTADYRIDRKRVYAAGHSNGGILAYRLACELPERIAAIAANAAAMMVDSCAPAHAVPVLHMHSRLDAERADRRWPGHRSGGRNVSVADIGDAKLGGDRRLQDATHRTHQVGARTSEPHGGVVPIEPRWICT